MIIDLLTNNKEIVDFVKKSEGFGGVIEKNLKNYKLINVQIGYTDHFCKGVDKFIEKKKISRDEYGYRILDPRGVVVREEGNLS